VLGGLGLHLTWDFGPFFAACFCVWSHGQVVFPRAYAELASWHAAHTEQAPELLAAAAEALDLVRTPSHRGWGGHLLLLGAQRVVCVSSTSVVFYYFLSVLRLRLKIFIC